MRYAATLVLVAAISSCRSEVPARPIVEVWSHHGPAEDVDVLFVIEGSAATAEARVALRESMPRFVRTLVTGDFGSTPDGADFAGARSVHLGVVSADMGTGGFMVETCAEPRFGDDGMLLDEGTGEVLGCPIARPPFLAFESGDDVEAFEEGAHCLIDLKSDGCRFRQPLDAALKALLPASDPARFVSGTTGHGDGANAGFLRQGSVLAVVLLSGEDDCSAIDPGVFDPASTTFVSPPELRCFLFPAAQHPLSRHADGLLRLRGGIDHRLVFVAIAGAPSGVSGPDGTSFDEILDHPAMAERADVGHEPPRLVPVCERPEGGAFNPARRMVVLAKLIEERGGHGVVGSACDADLAPVMEDALHAIADALAPACLETLLVRGPDGRVPCDLEVGGVAIPQLAVTDGAAPTGDGWFFDDLSPGAALHCEERGRIAFAGGASPADGAQMELRCGDPR